MTQHLKSMLELVKQIMVADIAYYKHDDPIMTDREYDALYDELSKLEQLTGIILSGSPTQRVSGEVLEGLTQVRHTKPEITPLIHEVLALVGQPPDIHRAGHYIIFLL